MKCKDTLSKKILCVAIVTVGLGTLILLGFRVSHVVQAGGTLVAAPLPTLTPTPVTPLWVSYGPEGGWVPALAVSPNYASDQTVFAAPYDSGVYKSTNGGTSWTQASIPFRPFFVAPSPNYTSDQTIFAGGSYAAFMRSIDSGQSWELLDLPIPPTDVRALAFSPSYATDHTILVIIRGGYLFKSTDSGTTWTHIAGVPDTGDAGLFVSPNYPADPTIYAGGEAGIYKSTDDGQTWAAIHGSLGLVSEFTMSPDFANDNLLMAFAGGGVFKSTDDGATWTRIVNADAWAISFSASYAVDGTIFIGGNSGIYKSTDRGGTWTWLDDGQPGAKVYQIAISPNYALDRTLFAGTFIGILRSTDGGNTWSFTNSGIRRQMWNLAVAVSPGYASDYTVFDAGPGVFKSTNGGLSWQQTSRGLPLPDIKALAPSPNFPSDGTALVSVRCGFPPYRTMDGGATWTPMGMLPCQPRAFAFSPAYESDRTIFATTGIGVYKSTDGGASWVNTSNGLTKTSAGSIAISSNYSQDQTVFVISGATWNGYTGDLYRSTDGGQTWALVLNVPNLHLVAVSPNYASDHTVVANNINAIYRSTDGGTSWTLISNQLYNASALIFSPAYTTDQSLYATAEHGSFVSRDGGVTWISLEDGKFFPRSITVGIRDGVADVFIGTVGESVWQRTLVQPTPPNSPPTADANGPYDVLEGDSCIVTASGSDPDGDPLTFAWDLDNDGTFETPGQSVSFSAAGLDGPSSYMIAVQVTDSGGLAATDQATVNVLNVMPMVDAGPDATIIEGDAFSGAGTFSDPGADTWTATVDYGDGSGVQPLTLTDSTFDLSHVYADAGIYAVTVTVTDDDGGEGSDTLTVTVLTPQEAIKFIIGEVEELVKTGVLNKGQGKSLIQKLENAIEKMNRGNTNAAINTLEAFINQVNDFINEGVLSPEEGQSLIDEANNVIDSLSGDQ